MILVWPNKDPQETLDYKLNWRSRILAGDKIIASEWTDPVGITKGVNTYTDYVTTLWLSGGTVGDKYEFTNRVTTQQGRILEQTIQITAVTK